NMTKRVLQIENLRKCLRVEVLRDVGIRFQIRAERALSGEGLHRVSLDEDVRVLPAQSFFDEREHDALRKIELARGIEVALHLLRIEHEPLHETARAIEHERERGRR